MSTAIQFQIETPDFAAISNRTEAGIREAFRSWTVNFWRLLVKERLSGRSGDMGLNRRTGNLSRDWIVDIQEVPGGISSEVRTAGTSNAYAGINETGGVIRPVNAKYLWIPLKANQTAAGVARVTPSQAISAGGFIAWHDGPIFYATSGTNAVGGAKKLIPMFVLKKEVKIKPRMGAGSLFQSQLPNLERLVAIEAQGGWG